MVAFAKNMQLQDFLGYCLWCGEEVALSLDPELHVKYPATSLEQRSGQGHGQEEAALWRLTVGWFWENGHDPEHMRCSIP